MIARIESATICGIDAHTIEVEAHVSSGLPNFSIVGLPDTAIREARERVKAGISNSEYEFPKRRIIVNLAPADLRKEGPAFDLPVALAVLAATRQIKIAIRERYVIVGELALDGAVRRVAGALAIAIEARDSGAAGIILPSANAKEAALISEIKVIPVRTLQEAVGYLQGSLKISQESPVTELDQITDESDQRDFSEIKGQEHAKRAMEIAAAGGHNILMFGPPGSGKTMLAEAFCGLLPPLQIEEAIETTKIYSAARMLSADKPLISSRPLRAPHHTVSDIAMTGGGVIPRPGEISLSHNGVLFLDEVNEFRRPALEVLRQPLEKGKITVSRVSGAVDYPTEFILLAAMNPCPCGFLGDALRDCVCTPQQIRGYRSKMSGPLRDRIDMHIEVSRLGKETMMNSCPSESSEAVRGRVMKARNAQAARFDGAKTRVNARMTHRSIRQHCILENNASEFLGDAIDRLGLTARSYTKILKVARTIADLEQRSGIVIGDIAEAIHYRTLDRQVRTI